MGSFIHDKNFLNDNIFLYEERLGSQYSIFFDNKTPTFVTYYHINNINSIADSGFLNVENILGSDSPIRFQKIENFPLYGIDSIKPDLSDDEEGLQTSYDSDAVILPNTIKPLPHDFFVISYLDNTFAFMVTEIEYDTIKSNNFYNIKFTLRSGNDINDLESQVLEKYKCIFHNIGTDDKCLIRSDEYEKLHELHKWYSNISKKYKTLFYADKYNSFLYNDFGTYIYDSFLTQFINNHELFAEKNSYNTLRLSDEDYRRESIIEYDDTIYKKIEERDKGSLEPIRVFRWDISYPDSIFKYYNMQHVVSIRFNNVCGDNFYISDELITNIKNNNITIDTDILGKILISHFNNRYNTIYDIDVDNLKNYRIKYDYNTFIMLPMVLYCISNIISHFFKTVDTAIE